MRTDDRFAEADRRAFADVRPIGLPRISAALVSVAVVAVVAMVLAGCGSDNGAAEAPETPSALEAAASKAAAAAERIHATTTPEPPPDHDGDGIPDVSDDYPFDPERSQAVEVRLFCWGGDSGDAEFTVVDQDFTEVWADETYSCDAVRNTAELSEVEQVAIDTAGFDNPNAIVTLYEICAVVDPDDVYTSGEDTASPEQVAEIQGALALCPEHPLADELATTLKHGLAAIEQEKIDAQLEQEGLLFRTGTFLVGEEIQPGTYVIEGDIDGCYWERQDRNGGIIDNDFIIAARRVQVTIRSSDYAFHNEGCGTWREQ